MNNYYPTNEEYAEAIENSEYISLYWFLTGQSDSLILFY